MARNPGCTVYIGNFDEKVPERVLYEILIQAGNVVDLYIPCDKESNRRRGYAFAEYETEDIAQYAVRLFSGLVRINDKLLKFTIAGHDKATSNGSQPVIPKLNATPLPKHQVMHCSGMTVSPTPAYSGIAGHDKPTSNGSQPVVPKLNPIPLPKHSQFMHCSDMSVSHTPGSPGVNGRIAVYDSSPNLNPYGIQPRALSGGPVQSQGELSLSNGVYDYNKHAFGSALNVGNGGPALNVGYGGPALNVSPKGAVQQPIMYPFY